MATMTTHAPAAAAVVRDGGASPNARRHEGLPDTRSLPRHTHFGECVSSHRHSGHASGHGAHDRNDAGGEFYSARKTLQRNDHAGQTRLTARGRLVLVIALLSFVTAFMIAGAWRATAAPAGPPAGWSQVIVQPGDSLWGFAVSGSNAGADPRATMAQIRSVNQVRDSTVRAGDRLWVPTPQR